MVTARRIGGLRERRKHEMRARLNAAALCLAEDKEESIPGHHSVGICIALAHYVDGRIW